MDLSLWSQSQLPMGGFIPPSSDLALVGSGRVPALPYPPPRQFQFISQHSGWSILFALARRVAAAVAKFLFPCRPDCLSTTGPSLSIGSDVGNRAV